MCSAPHSAWSIFYGPYHHPLICCWVSDQILCTPRNLPWHCDSPITLSYTLTAYSVTQPWSTSTVLYTTIRLQSYGRELWHSPHEPHSLGQCLVSGRSLPSWSNTWTKESCILSKSSVQTGISVDNGKPRGRSRKAVTSMSEHDLISKGKRKETTVAITHLDPEILKS